MVLERPKVIHNRQTGKFIMWMHIDTADYELARTGVAVSDSPIGPFRYQGSFRPHGQQSRDFTVYAVSQLLLQVFTLLFTLAWQSLLTVSGAFTVEMLGAAGCCKNHSAALCCV